MFKETIFRSVSPALDEKETCELKSLKDGHLQLSGVLLILPIEKAPYIKAPPFLSGHPNHFGFTCTWDTALLCSQVNMLPSRLQWQIIDQSQKEDLAGPALMTGLNWNKASETDGIFLIDWAA